MTEKLLAGLRKFRTVHFPLQRARFRELVEKGQKPGTLFIGCSDSRVMPELLTGAGPGELFVVRNAGNFVPPFEPDAGDLGTAAAIEFAVLALGVNDIVVCGHSHCGAVRALYSPPSDATPHLKAWVRLASDAKLDAEPTDDVLRRTEQRSVALQLSRLMTYPMVRERVERGELALHGWYYVIEDGDIRVLDDTGEFLAAH